MKKKDLEKQLEAWGYEQYHGGRHDIWKKNGLQIQVPRHAEIKEGTARAILKKAKNHK